jgi:hypothetical protein
MNSMPTNPDRVFTGLNPAQADGLACVHCGTGYLAVRVPHQPVGRSETDSQVFVCVGQCTDAVELVTQARAMVAANAAANEEFAKGFRMTTCPPWCTEDTGHAWERFDETSVSRTHSQEFFGKSNTDVAVMVDMTERLDEAGEITMLPPSVYVSDMETSDLGVLIRVAQAVLAAAEMMRGLEHARQDLESLMNIIKAGA